MKIVEDRRFIDKNGKPIALLFGPKFAVLRHFLDLWWQLKIVENRRLLTKMASL